MSVSVGLCEGAALTPRMSYLDDRDRRRFIASFLAEAMTAIQSRALLAWPPRDRCATMGPRLRRNPRGACANIADAAGLEVPPSAYLFPAALVTPVGDSASCRRNLGAAMNVFAPSNVVGFVFREKFHASRHF